MKHVTLLLAAPSSSYPTRTGTARAVAAGVQACLLQGSSPAATLAGLSKHNMRVLFLQGFVSPDMEHEASDAIGYGITSAEAIVAGPADE